MNEQTAQTDPVTPTVVIVEKTKRSFPTKRVVAVAASLAALAAAVAIYRKGYLDGTTAEETDEETVVAA